MTNVEIPSVGQVNSVSVSDATIPQAKIDQKPVLMDILKVHAGSISI